MGGDIGEIYKYINHYAVVTKASSKIILVQVYIIFALPDYSSEIIERHQNLFYGRLIVTPNLQIRVIRLGRPSDAWTPCNQNVRIICAHQAGNICVPDHLRY